MSNKSKNIELELRAEVSSYRFQKLLLELKKNTKQISATKRLSIMFLGSIQGTNFDIRIRINSDGKAEIVIKKGDFHVHDRIEVSQKIKKDQLLGFVDIFSLLKFRAKVTERENFEFDLGGGVVMVLVKADLITYVEVEKMSDRENLEVDRDELLRIMNNFNLKAIEDGKEFNKLCDRLTEHSDWEFNGSAKQKKKLKLVLDSY